MPLKYGVVVSVKDCQPPSAPEDGSTTGITQIRHYDRKRFVAVGAFVEPGYNVQRVNQVALALIRAADLDPGVTIKVAGEQEFSAESLGGIGLVVIVTIFGFIGVLRSVMRQMELWRIGLEDCSHHRSLRLVDELAESGPTRLACSNWSTSLKAQSK